VEAEVRFRCEAIGFDGSFGMTDVGSDDERLLRFMNNEGLHVALSRLELGGHKSEGKPKTKFSNTHSTHDPQFRRSDFPLDVQCEGRYA
jgi:hypothetical protein